MRRSKWILYSCVLLISFILGGCGNLVAPTDEENASKQEEVKLFDDFTDIESFQGVPVMAVANGKVEVQGDIGAGNQVAIVSGGEVNEYWAYLDVLSEYGYEKKYDNGNEGLYNKVFSAVVMKDDLSISVIHMSKSKVTYIVAEEGLDLSESLFKKETTTKDHIKDAVTLHMVELNEYGNSFVLQLKNGHFILCDGGRAQDLEHLLTYLESLVPNGEKPVIEAWLITHPHGDHAALFTSFVDNWTYAERIYVEEIYMDTYNSDVSTRMDVTKVSLAVRTAAEKLHSTDGGHPTVYRPQAGHKYYYDDVQIDVMQTMIQCPEESWYRWTENVNEFSAWFMFNIEGQRYLNIGDADFGAMRSAMRTYDPEDFEMDIMAVSHHGINVHNEFTDFIKVNTLLYPNFGIYGSFLEGQSWGGSWQASENRNQYLHEKVLESYSFIDGTVVLTFPYKVGTAQSLGATRTDRVEITDEHRIKYY